MIVQTLLPNLIPLYALIAFGFAGGRWMDINLHSMAVMAIYFIAPIVIFGAVAQVDFQPEYLALPLVLAFISFTVTMLSYNLARRFFPAKMASLIGMASSTGNTGYFGLPLILAIYGADQTGIYILGNYGAEVVAITLGYYFGARGNFHVKDSLMKLVKLPVIHGLWIGVVWNIMALPLPDSFLNYWGHFTGAWVVIGMMLIGVALGKIPKFELNFKLIGWLSVVKFLIWPLLVGLFIWLDQSFFGLFGADIYGMFLIFSLCPLAGNVVAFAAQLDVHPEEAAMAVLISTIIALFYIPLVFVFLGSPLFG